MALIICPECNKEYSDRAIACPNCGCPTATPISTGYVNTDISETPKQEKSHVGVIITVIILILCVIAGLYTYKSIKYAEGIDALYSGEYAVARECLEGLNFKDSELMLTDVSFLEDLEKSVERNIDYCKENPDELFKTGRLEADLETFKEYKKANFYIENLNYYYSQYINALRRQKDAFDESFSNPCVFEYELIAGNAQCDDILIILNEEIGFMNSDPDFKEYIKDEHQDDIDFLKRINELQESGHIETKETSCSFSSVTRYLRNDTDYVSDQIFIFDFYAYESDTFLERVEVNVDDIPANSEYIVKCSIPRSAKDGYTVYYSHFYTDIRLSDTPKEITN